jgi:hypothetical protein
MMKRRPDSEGRWVQAERDRQHQSVKYLWDLKAHAEEERRRRGDGNDSDNEVGSVCEDRALGLLTGMR